MFKPLGLQQKQMFSLSGPGWLRRASLSCLWGVLVVEIVSKMSGRYPLWFHFSKFVLARFLCLVQFCGRSEPRSTRVGATQTKFSIFMLSGKRCRVYNDLGSMSCTLDVGMLWKAMRSQRWKQSVKGGSTVRSESTLPGLILLTLKGGVRWPYISIKE